MTHSRVWVMDPQNRERVLTMYREQPSMKIIDIAAALNTTEHNVCHVTRHYLTETERKQLAALRYAEPKQGAKNPMFGKTRDRHPRWVGLCETGLGYLSILHNGKRQLAHRVVMATALGLDELPEHLHVHHIDGNKTNNDLDNLALLTDHGHRAVHRLQRPSRA